MAKRVRVALFGEQRRSIKIDADATEGATIGRNLLWPDGKTVQESEIRSTTVVQSGSTTALLWALLIGIPVFIKNLASLTGIGFVARASSAGTAGVRTLTGETGRIVVTNGDGAAGNPIIALGNWPTVKNSVVTGETATIPAGHQMIVMDEFVFGGGQLNIDGELIVL